MDLSLLSTFLIPICYKNFQITIPVANVLGLIEPHDFNSFILFDSIIGIMIISTLEKQEMKLLGCFISFHGML